jgi:hypothetical protein
VEDGRRWARRDTHRPFREAQTRQSYTCTFELELAAAEFVLFQYGALRGAELKWELVKKWLWRNPGVSSVGVVAALAASMCGPPEYDVSLARCDDGERNGRETGVDCGGLDCKKCLNEQGCRTASDCVSDECVAGVCGQPHCGNLVKDQDEQDVDCGGADCVACGDSCSNQRKDDDETDVDCGGSSKCDRCEAGFDCESDTDCVSRSCTVGVCASRQTGLQEAAGAAGSLDAGGEAEAGVAGQGPENATAGGGMPDAPGGSTGTSVGPSAAGRAGETGGMPGEVGTGSGGEPSVSGTGGSTSGVGGSTGGALSTGGVGGSTGGALSTGGVGGSTGGAVSTGGAGGSTGGAVSTGGSLNTGGTGGSTGGSGGAGGSTGGSGGAGGSTGGSGGAGGGGGNCDGVVDSGICWRLGALGASCAATCARRGGVSSDAPSHVGTAAQGGSSSECSRLLRLLGVTGNLIQVQISAGLGCHVKSGMPIPNAWASSPDYNDDASESGVRIVCGCLL